MSQASEITALKKRLAELEARHAELDAVATNLQIAHDRLFMALAPFVDYWKRRLPIRAKAEDSLAYTTAPAAKGGAVSLTFGDFRRAVKALGGA